MKSLGTARPALAPAGLLFLRFQEALELASCLGALKSIRRNRKNLGIGLKKKTIQLPTR